MTDHAQGAVQPDWWRWRYMTNYGWSKWISLNDDEVAAFRDLQHHNLEAGKVELQPLYAVAEPSRCNNPVARGESKGAGATTGDAPVVSAPTPSVQAIAEHVRMRANGFKARGTSIFNGNILAEELHDIADRLAMTEGERAAQVPSVDELYRIICIEFPTSVASRDAAERIWTFLSARAKTLARQTTASVLPCGEGQAAECDGGLHPSQHPSTNRGSAA